LVRWDQGAVEGAAGRVEARQSVETRDGSAAVDITLQVAAASAGDYVYGLRVPVQEGEQVTTDNTRTQPLQVLDQRARVLLISGGPSWEYRLVRTVLMRERAVDLSCWLQSISGEDTRQDGNTVIESLPDTPSELFAYDVILFMDPDPADFGAAWMAMLERYLAEHGGGVLWMAGPAHTASFFGTPGAADILDMLPVVPAPRAGLLPEQLAVTFTRQWPLKVAPDGVDHAVFRLHEDPVINRRLVEQLPGICWSFPVERVKPAARVLVTHEDPRLRTAEGPRPLLVSGRYGAGRTLYMGFDGTWRWRRYGERVFVQWWVQTVRYLMEGRLMGSRTRGTLATDRDRYAPGERVEVTARLYGIDYQPLDREQVAVELTTPDGAREAVTLQRLEAGSGRYAGGVVAAQAGLHVLETELAAGEGQAAERLQRRFTVEMPRVEFADPRMNRAFLEGMAHASGGAFFTVADAGKLPAAVPDRRETVAVPSRPIPLWDTWHVLALVTALLSAEWIMRRMRRLL
jgi:hypothetical protein